MATLADLKSQVSVAVLALPGGTKTRLASDYLESSQVVIGETGVQVRATYLNTVNPDSSLSTPAARVEIVMARRLAAVESERVYADGDMVADQVAMISREFWTDLDAVYSLVEDDEPGVSLQPELRGAIFVYSVIADVIIAAA